MNSAQWTVHSVSFTVIIAQLAVFAGISCLQGDLESWAEESWRSLKDVSGKRGEREPGYWGRVAWLLCPHSQHSSSVCKGCLVPTGLEDFSSLYLCCLHWWRRSEEAGDDRAEHPSLRVTWWQAILHGITMAAARIQLITTTPITQIKGSGLKNSNIFYWCNSKCLLELVQNVFIVGFLLDFMSILKTKHSCYSNRQLFSPPSYFCSA